MLKVLRTFSLRSRLIIVYVFILGAGGLITSFISSIIINSTIMSQARNKVHHDLKTARMVYNGQLDLIAKAVYLLDLLKIKNGFLLHRFTLFATFSLILVLNNLVE